MSCCRNNIRNYYTRSYQGNNSCCNNVNDDYDDNCCYDNHSYDNDCHDSNDLDGVSCPFHNNNDCCCAESLRDAACRLTNQRVVIYTEGCKMCVVIVGIGDTFIKTVNPNTHRIVYFNVNRIDNIEDVLPRCNY